VRDVSSLAAFAQPVALDGSRENDGGRALVFERRLVGGVHLARVVAALPQCSQRLVRKVLDHFQKARVRSEYLLANVSAGFDAEFLHFAVHHSPRRFTSRPSVSRSNSGSQSLPHRTFDAIPAGAPEGGFEFLNDLAVAANRAVQPLQVAIDHKDEIVEIFARSQSNGSQTSPARPSRRLPGTPTLSRR
jgi:hypothetical protein